MEEFYINSDGIRLHAKLERPEGTDKSPLCILIHGFTGNMEEDHLLAVKDVLLEKGIAVLRAEMYGHGGSDGEFKDHTLYKWVINALDVVKYAKTLDFVTDLYLCGHSQGGLLTMLVGGMCENYFKAIIPLSPAWMIPEGARRGNLIGIDFDPVHIPDVISSDWATLSGDYVRVAQTIHVEDEIERYKGQVFIIHGDEDMTVPYFYGQKAEELYENAKLVTVKGADHCFNGHLEELKQGIASFFS
ncbi:MAG: alpha/beta hydrolase [Clostridiales bacterium]|nr:alpha/beta hydrolase [Clostridiales bacterium]